MEVLEKNEYLKGLEKLYKKYGINKVYVCGTGYDTYVYRAFYVENKLSEEAVESLDEYTTNPNNEDIYAIYSGNVTDIDGLNLFYENGVFYGKRRRICPQMNL